MKRSTAVVLVTWAASAAALQAQHVNGRVDLPRLALPPAAVCESNGDEFLHELLR